MKQRLTIKTEGSAERCEVCHKSDYLEPNSTVCLRCQDIDIPLTLSKLNGHKEEEISGVFFAFGRNRATRAVASLLALFFVIDIIGLAGTAFSLGLFCSIAGTHRLASGVKLSSKSILEIVVSLTLIGGGLTCSYLSGLHLLKWSGIFR